MSNENIAQLLHNFSTFIDTASPSLFGRIFGPDMGEHLWGKYMLYKGNTTTFYCYLDSENRAALVSFLVDKTEQYEEKRKAYREHQNI